MKYYYTSESDHRKQGFILGYDITRNGKEIIIKQADNSTKRIPYSEEDIKKLNEIMKKQVKGISNSDYDYKRFWKATYLGYLCATIFFTGATIGTPFIIKLMVPSAQLEMIIPAIPPFVITCKGFTNFLNSLEIANDMEKSELILSKEQDLKSLGIGLNNGDDISMRKVKAVLKKVKR